tara:strand:+ start:4234 stop:5079 length:846 start_codon:yes stop_codon:yes gene_type:complete
MKNIHILPTNNSSKLGIYNKNLILHRKGWRNGTQHIYITSDEEIKEGDWVLFEGNTTIRKAIDSTFTSGVNHIRIHNDNKIFKIILTTDQDLIADGVQSIDDDFLEWFVKNSSCEEVELKKWFDTSYIDLGCGRVYNNNPKLPLYKIIIPNEQPKQETIGYICPQTKRQCNDECCVSSEDCHIEAGIGIIFDSNEPIEEAAKNYIGLAPQKSMDNEERYYNPNVKSYDAFIKGANWYKEKSYNEAEVKDIVEQTIEKFYKHLYSLTKEEMKSEWFKQFKKS